jgi:putative PIN family toxin of toxin-antitoxin system
MTVPHCLFLDANVWFAAAVSPRGGSAMLLALCQEGQCEATVTRRILREAEQNLRTKAKFRDEPLVRFYRLIAVPGLKVVSNPSQEEAEIYAAIVHAKDTHVLAGVYKAKAEALITLDRKHFCTASVRQAKLPFEILTPGALLQRLVSG